MNSLICLPVKSAGADFCCACAAPVARTMAAATTQIRSNAGAPLLRRTLQPRCTKMRQNFIDVHHVGILVMHVEQIDLVGEFGAIIGALLDNADMEAA